MSAEPVLRPVTVLIEQVHEMKDPVDAERHAVADPVRVRRRPVVHGVRLRTFGPLAPVDPIGPAGERRDLFVGKRAVPDGDKVDRALEHGARLRVRIGRVVLRADRDGHVARAQFPEREIFVAAAAVDEKLHLRGIDAAVDVVPRGRIVRHTDFRTRSARRKEPVILRRSDFRAQRPVLIEQIERQNGVPAVL